ncbi:hypothetical protein ILFOPFJJ_01480 [Ensifer psoraleae]|uniref:hypothetical protein n=1 Tax=Sinorhizobium psoraleae TaxID=520838 RepID=UPI001569C01E|nr:hypothetical protein [Sinorhizobium psoraleae]NRP70599.1 hypothetical protein [Sinorhizobium psoraleae]
MERTTAEHRAAVDAWRATAPKDDSDIFEKPRKSTKPRHRDLSELSALLAIRNRPVGAIEDGPKQPLPIVQTNWRLTPANDNKKPEDFGTERAVEYIPSPEAIKESLTDVVMKYRQEPMMLPGMIWDEDHADAMSKREIHAIPVDGDFECGTHIDEDGKPHKVIVRIGKLRFSDGTQTEPGHKLVEGKVVNSPIKMPVGAMLGTREKSTRDKGSAPDPLEEALTFDYFAGRNDPPGLFKNVQTARPVKKTDRRPKEPPTTKAQDRQTLADAMAKTNVPITKCHDGFPAGPRNLAQLFPGLVKVATGDSGFHTWQDVVSERIDRDLWSETLQAMKDEDISILTQATEAKSLKQIGEARGYTGKYAIAAGRRLLVAANDNFERAMEIAKEARQV